MPLVILDEGRFELGLGESLPCRACAWGVCVCVQMHTCTGIFGKAKRRFPAN